MLNTYYLTTYVVQSLVIHSFWVSNSTIILLFWFQDFTKICQNLGESLDLKHKILYNDGKIDVFHIIGTERRLNVFSFLENERMQLILSVFNFIEN